LGAHGGYPRLSELDVPEWQELDVPEWQELAGDRLEWREMLKSTKTRT
jgi:hypothetical protein